MSEITELLERFRRGPELVAVATTGASGSQLDHKPATDKWSARLIACHLADFEMTGSIRMRQVIAEDEPAMQVYDPDAWTARLGYERRKISQVLESFRRTRADNYELLKDLPEETFARAGNHPRRGRLTLLDLLRLYAEHAEKHAKQIMAVRQHHKETKPK